MGLSSDLSIVLAQIYDVTVAVVFDCIVMNFCPQTHTYTILLHAKIC